MANRAPLQKKFAYFNAFKAIAVICLIVFIALALLIIIEAAMPGELSARQSDFVSKVLLSLKGNGNADENPPAPSRIDIECDAHFAGEKAPISVSFYPSSSGAYPLSYSSGDESVAKIDGDGLISFMSFGQTEITATLNSDRTVYDKVRITCLGTNPMFISQISMQKYVLCEGERLPLHIYDEKGARISSDIFDIISDDENVVRIDKYHITAMKRGAANITFSHAQSGFSQTIAYKVTANEDFIIPSGFGFSTAELSLNKGDGFDLDELMTNISPTGANACYDVDYLKSSNLFNLEWRGSNRYEAVHAGETVIAVKSCFNPECTASLKLSIAESAPTELRVIGGESRLVIGNSYNLRAFGDGDFVNQVLWSTLSGDAKIDSDGKITSIRTGKSTVRATSILNPAVYADVEIEFALFKNFKTFVRAFFGHFLTFALFGFFLAAFIFLISKPRGLYPVVTLICGTALAVVSELLQLPTINTGRGASIRDVMTDVLGVICGVAVFSAVLGLYILIKRKTAPDNFRIMQCTFSEVYGKTVFLRCGKYLSAYDDVYRRL